MSSKEAAVRCDGDASPSSADEGDNNKSFVTKVKSHVTGLLPSKLSTWLGGKSRQRDDHDDDDVYELQPPTKRVKTHNLDFDLSGIASRHAPLPNPFSQEFREPLPSTSTSSATTTNTRKLVLPASNHYNQNHVEHTNGVDSDSGESTSGYSSMPRIGSKELVSEMPGSSKAQATLNSTLLGNKSIFNTSIPLERSLFGEHLTSPKQSNSSLSSRRPSFNASTFGAATFMDKTLSTRRIFNSPFYSGRIAYGGASAYNRSLLNTSLDRQPQTPTVQPKLVNDNSRGAALSKTAKRILDTLEQYTSPVADVRRIPTERRGQRIENSLIGRYVGVNPYTVRNSPKMASNQELQVPATSDLLKMKLKERLQDSTSSMREMTTNTVSALNIEEYTIGNSEDNKQATGKSTNKIKAKVASVRQKAAAVDDDIAPVVKLPDVQLPISTLPTFNFSIPLGDAPKVAVNMDQFVSVPVEKPIVNFGVSFADSKKATNSTSPTKLPEVAPPTINFKNPEVKSSFVSAIPKPAPKMTLPKLPTVLQETQQLVKTTTLSPPAKIEFKFSKPLVIAENNFKSIKAINNFKFSQPVVKKAVKNGLSPSKKVHVVSDVTLPKKGFGDAFKVCTDKWECTTCLVRNIATANICISCTTPKVTLKRTVNGSAKAPTLTTASWGDKFKAPANSWTCSECMITNDVTREKCAACETPKNKTTVAPESKVTGFDAFKTKTDEWECPSCMIKNANAKDKCVCCETPKPGAKPTTATSKPPLVASSWGDKFKAPSTTWECSVCMIRNNVNKDKCVACENPRPAGIASPEGDGFKKASEWECSSCMVRNPSNKEKCVCCEAPKPGSKTVPTAQVKEVPKFSFGIENGLINGQGFVFGIPADKNVVKSYEKKSDPSISVEKPTESGAPNTQFLFGIKSPPNGAKTALPSAPIAPPTISLAAETKPADGIKFSFGIPAAKRSAPTNDEADAPPTPKKSDTAIKPVINGSLDKTEEHKAKVPSFSFGTRSEKAAEDTSKNIFGAPKPSESAASITTAAPPAFTFNAATPVSLKTSTPAVPVTATSSTFKFSADVKPAALPSVAPPAFGASSNATNGSTPSFSFTPAKPATTKPEEPFKFSTPSSNVAKPTFGSTKSTSNVFGSPATPAVSNVFGSNATQATPAAPAHAFGSGSVFGNGCLTGSTPVTFGGGKTTAPTFGAPAAATAQPPAYGANNAPAFGKPATNGVFSFGSSNNQNAEPNKAFNFSGSTPTPAPPGAFSFGAPTNTQNTSGAFNFGASNFNAPDAAKSTFNFSSAPSTADVKQAPPGRVIRRALRRTQR